MHSKRGGACLSKEWGDTHPLREFGKMVLFEIRSQENTTIKHCFFGKKVKLKIGNFFLNFIYGFHFRKFFGIVIKLNLKSFF